MTTKQETKKLVGNCENKKKPIDHRVRVDAIIFKKFSKKIHKLNRGKDYKNRITHIDAATEALRMWMEKNAF